MKKLFTILFFILLLASCSVGGSGEKLSVGDRMPDFEALTMGGEAVSSESLFGKPTVIVFFNTHCPDCWGQMPEIQKLWNYCEDYINVLAVARDETASSVTEYFSINGYTMPVVVPENRDIYNLFDRGSYTGVPQVYVCDAEGVVILCGDDTALITANEIAEIAKLEKYVVK